MALAIGQPVVTKTSTLARPRAGAKGVCTRPSRSRTGSAPRSGSARQAESAASRSNGPGRKAEGSQRPHLVPR